MGVWFEDYEDEPDGAPSLVVTGSYFVGPLAFGFDPQDGDPRDGPELDRAWAKQKKRTEAARLAREQG